MAEYITSDEAHDGAVARTVAPLDAGADFTSNDCGTSSGSATGPALEPGSGHLAINGRTDLSSCVVGNSGACVYQFYLSRNPPPSIYSYLIEIEAQGPSGAGSGNLWLDMTDADGGSYRLKIFSSTRKWHFVTFNSSAPGITKLAWSPTKP